MSTPPNKALAELMEADMQRVAEASFDRGANWVSAAAFIAMASPYLLGQGDNPVKKRARKEGARKESNLLASRLKAEGRPRMVGHSAACVCGLCTGGAV